MLGEAESGNVLNLSRERAWPAVMFHFRPLLAVRRGLCASGVDQASYERATICDPPKGRGMNAWSVCRGPGPAAYQSSLQTEDRP